MNSSLTLKLGAMAALYLFWLVCWLVLDAKAFGPAHYNWDTSLISGLTAIMAFTIGQKLPQPYSLFLRVISIGTGLLALSWITYDPNQLHSFLRFSEPGLPDYSNIFYALFVFCWVCAWGYLALTQWQRQPPSALTKTVFVLLFIGLAVILSNFYYPLYSKDLNTIDGRLDAATSFLEFILLITGLACIFLGESILLTWMLLATALLVATDMAYSKHDVPEDIEAMWMFGQCLLFSAILALPNAIAFIQTDRRRCSSMNGIVHHRSSLSGILILLSLGGVLLFVALGLLPIHTIWKSFSAVIFIVSLVAIQVWLTDHFDDTVRFLRTFSAQMLKTRLLLPDWRTADTDIQATLRSTGMDSYLDWLRQSLKELRQDILFLGPERLYPVPKEPSDPGKIRCFIVMPFSHDWSDEVHQTLATSCKASSIQSMRGDDVFTPTDILIDIWHSINTADFVIADITGRNPNVLYELGIAHTLAKPVLILSQSATDIPIDLSTRRVIIYTQNETNWQSLLANKVSKAINEILALYSLKPFSGAETFVDNY
jgi:hypothetical protein